MGELARRQSSRAPSSGQCAWTRAPATRLRPCCTPASRPRCSATTAKVAAGTSPAQARPSWRCTTATDADRTMAADADETGFLSRWARRKAQVRQGTVLDDPAAPTLPPAPPAVEPPAATLVAKPPVAASEKTDPPPTLADVAELTRDSDYTRFVAQGVQPEVKNAALKKTVHRPALQRDGRAGHLHRRLRQTRSAARGHAAPDGAVQDARPVRRRRRRTPAPATPAAPTDGLHRPPPRPPPMKTLICDCNRTMPLDAPALSQALAKTPGASTDGLETVHTLLCRREAGAFQRAAKASGASGDELLVACTQERRLFLELNDADRRRGQRGASGRSTSSTSARPAAGRATAAPATPKIAALIAAAQLPAPAPVATVSYRSGGRCLVIGAGRGRRARGRDAGRQARRERAGRPAPAAPWRKTTPRHAQRPPDPAGRLARRLRGRVGERQPDRPRPVHPLQRLRRRLPRRRDRLRLPGRPRRLQEPPRLRARVRRRRRDRLRPRAASAATSASTSCSTCARSRPSRCTSRRRATSTPARDERALIEAVLALRELTGEFEKPKFFRYQQQALRAQPQRADRLHRLHRRLLGARDPQRRLAQGQDARREAAGGVIVEPHLCVGCGACSTVCPSGAMSFAYPGPVDQGRRLRTLLTAYAHAGGRDAALLIHSEGAGARLRRRPGPRRARRPHAAAACRRACCRWRCGTPPASASTCGWRPSRRARSQVWVLADRRRGARIPRRRWPSRWRVAQAMLTGLGYAAEHFRLLEARDARDLAALDAALRAPPAQRRGARGRLRGAGRQARHARTGARPPARAGAAPRATRSRCRPPARRSAACWSTPTSARCA